MIAGSMMLVATALALAYWLGFCWRDDAGWHRSSIKTGSMLFLAIAAATLNAPVWVVLGLGLGALGDLCLSRPGQKAFLAGMAAFALGHLAYGFGFAQLWQGAPWGPALAVLALAASTEVWLIPRTGPLRWPVRGYGLVIGLMGLAALGQPVLLLQAGAGLFLLSDVLLALALFVWPGRRWVPLLSALLWPAYWLGQFLILQGALSLPLGLPLLHGIE